MTDDDRTTVLLEEKQMKSVCFEPMKTNDGKNAICGAVQMTGFKPGQHTIRADTPCKGCGAINGYDGVGDDWTAESHNGLPAINSHIKPIREL